MRYLKVGGWSNMLHSCEPRIGPKILMSQVMIILGKGCKLKCVFAKIINVLSF